MTKNKACPISFINKQKTRLLSAHPPNSYTFVTTTTVTKRKVLLHSSRFFKNRFFTLLIWFCLPRCNIHKGRQNCFIKVGKVQSQNLDDSGESTWTPVCHMHVCQRILDSNCNWLCTPAPGVTHLQPIFGQLQLVSQHCDWSCKFINGVAQFLLVLQTCKWCYTLGTGVASFRVKLLTGDTLYLLF